MCDLLAIQSQECYAIKRLLTTTPQEMAAYLSSLAMLNKCNGAEAETYMAVHRDIGELGYKAKGQGMTLEEWVNHELRE